MKNFVLDADALIKLTKTDLIKKISEKINLLITEEVFNEAVIEGKNKLYKDAFIIEDLIKDKLIKKASIKLVKKELPDLGIEELSTLNAYEQNKANVIVSDDRRFLNILDEKSVKFTTPVSLMVAMHNKKLINKKDAIAGMNKIKNLVGKYVYESAIKEIGG